MAASNTSAYEELRKLVNDVVSTGTVSKPSGTASASGSGSRDTSTASKKESTSDYFSSRRKALGLDRTNVDNDYINSFIADSKNYMNGAISDKARMGFGTSKSIYESRKKQSDELKARSSEIQRFLKNNQESLDSETYESLKNYLDTFDKTSSQAIYSFYRNKEFYSQFDSEDAYNDYVAKQKDYEKKVNLDLSAAEKEIADLEAKRDAYYWNTDYDATSHNDRVAFEKSLEVMDDEIAQKKQFLNQARHIQEGITLSGAVDNSDFREYSGYVSTKSDNRWDKLLGKEYDDTYEYVNNQDGFRDNYKSEHRAYSSDNPWSDGESSFEEKGYDYLKENEIAIYNYYYAKEGKEKAKEYLDSIQETLNLRKATGMYENMEDKTALELAFGVAAGLDQWESGMKNLFNTEDDYIPQTATQMASGMVREDLADEGPKLPGWMGGASLGQVGYDAITTTANMAPSIMTSMAANMIAPGSGAFVGNAMMFASSAGNAYQEALNLGYDKSQARAYSTLVGASEAGLQYLLGGIGNLGGKVSGGAISKILNGVDNAFARTAIKLGGNMLSEGLEEGLQEILTPWFKNLTLHADEDINWSEVAYSTLLGALTAGFMEGGSTISGEVNNYNTGRQVKESDISVQRLADIGKTFSADTVAYQLAGRVNENTGAYTIGRLFNEIGATMTEQNVNEITNALMRKGMDEGTAKKNAKALAYVVEGGQLTEKQVAVIEANDVLAEVARNTLIDANTTWNQRTKGYNEALMALAQEKVSPKASQTKAAEAGKENTPASDKVGSQNENGSEVDVSPTKVGSITGIKNRMATIKLEDGSEVSARDADLSPEDGVRIETIAKIDGISAADANTILNTLKVSTGASAQMDSLGATEAYKYGYYGFSMEHMTKHGVFANSLTEAQRKTIYEVGQRARQQQIEKNTPKKTDGTVKKTGIYFDAGNGNVVPYSESNMTLDKKRSAGVQAAMVLHKLGIGGDIYFFESYLNRNKQRVYKDKNGVERPAPNGWYAKDGSIHIDLNAGNKGEGYVLFTLAHELTHFIEQWSPQKYKVLADFLVENYEKGQSMDQLVRAKQAKLSQSRGKKVSYREAYSEVVADSMEAMLADGNVLDKLIELKTKDNALFTKMKQFFDNLVAKIRNVYKGLTPDSDEGKAVLEMTDSIEKIQQLFADALVEASENFQSAEKNTTEDGGEQMMVRENVVDVNGNKYDKVIKPGLKVYDSVKHKKKDYISHLRKKIFKRTFTLNDSNGEQITVEFGKDGEIVQKDGANNPHPVLGELEATTDRLKMIAIINIKDLIKNSKPLAPSSENSHQWLDEGGWRDRISYMTDFDVIYPVILHIPKTRDGRYLLYDVSVLKKEGTSIDMDATALSAPGARAPETTENGLQSAVEVLEPSGKRVTQPKEKVKNESVEAMDIEMDKSTESVSPAVLMSERTWTESDYVQERDKAAKEIAKAIGVSEKKAKEYIDSVNSIAKMIADDRTRLDYFSSPGRSSFVGNVEYGGSFDFSTLCKKRRLLTGTFTAIQKALPNTALTANEILDIRNRMKKAGLEVSCGLCYVEGSRANMGQFAKEFLKLYKQYYPDAWQPNMADVNTPDGIEWVRINHPEVYEQYEYFWNHYGTLKSGDKNLFASQQKPKLYQLHTEYKGEILEKFNDDDNVEDKNLNGGIRLQSFSDFEIVHLIDTMQIIMDMSRVGLAGQAYTKVPDFAWALGDTGLKINLSLIAKGVDENGKLIFDDVEGMPIDTAVALRNRYSKNVGTILVAFNDEQLLAAMADDRVDFIIPFHRSQWKKSQYEAMGLPAKTKDYTYMQNEKFIKPQFHEYRGRMVKDKATNYMPNEYWDFAKSGKENAEAYLEMCARNNKRPKFYKLLQNNGDGSYSLKADGSTDGYWKLLIDFKMYDNDGNGSPQMTVKPDFNMEEATRMLNEYSGGHSNFPVAQGIVDSFVEEYKDSHEGVQFSDRNAVDNSSTVDKNSVINTRGDNRVKQEAYEDAKYSDRDYGTARGLPSIGKYKERTPTVRELWDDIAKISLRISSLEMDLRHAERDGYVDHIKRVRGRLADVEEIYIEYGEYLLDNYEKYSLADIRRFSKALKLVDTFASTGSYTIEQFRNDLTEKLNAYRKDTEKVLAEEVKTMSREDQKLYMLLKLFGAQTGYDSSELDGVTEETEVSPDDAWLSDGEPFFSERTDDSVSNRSLLANAFESVVKNDIERNRLQEYKGKISLIESEERKLSELNEQIKDLSFAKGPKDTKKIRALQFEANQAANRINTYDKQLLRLEASLPLQNVLNREKEMARKRAEQKGKEALEAYRERATKTQRELLNRWQESRKRGIDSRQRTAMRHKIKDVVNDLNQYLLKGTKDRHVPIGLQKAVAEALNAVNMDTVGAEERIAKLNAELMKAKTPEAIQEISKKIEHIREMGDRMDEKLKRLKTAYDEFINSDDPLIANSHDDAVSAHMMKLIVRVGDTPLREMTIDQLQDVYDVYKVVLATIRNANKSFKDNKNREISTRANQVMAEIDNLGVKRGKRPVFMSWIEKFGWDGLKPVYAMEHIGSNGLIDAYNNVRAGEDTWAQNIVEAREYYLEKFKKYKYDSWDFEKKHKFTSTTEKNFELTLDQIMSLYAYSKRDQAADHLKYGGIVFDPKTEVVEKTKSGIKVKYNIANATAYNISEETLADIISKLTEEQKGFVDEMQAYLSDVMGAKGNEVSLAMYDVKLFREKNYFPLKSAHQYMAKAKEQAQGDVKIKNSGFSKETKPHAKNPIVLSSFMDVWTNHVNEMSMYHAFVLPMEDFYRIYNYTTPSKDENLPTEGVTAYIENAYGSGATEYIEQMLKDLNGGARTDSRTGFINKMMGLFKKGAVFASLSVVVQQPSAIARAAALVDTKYFIGPKVDHKRHKALWEEVKQYAPVAIIKEMGYFDTNMGKSTQDFIMGQEYSGFSEKMKALVTDSNYRDEILSKAPALADEIAWCSIWEAVKREIRANNPGMDVSSEEFLQKAGERFTEVITKTQVYDSVLSRSALMRSKDTGMKMATAFMAEPTTSINMVADALLKGKRGSRKYARTAIGAVIASQILNSILVSFVYAGRDDDEDETYVEKYIGTLTGEILDSLNPAGYIPFIKDIVSIVQGYDVERSDMAVVSDLWKAWQNLSKDNVSVYRKVEGFAGSIAQIFGLPVKNIMRDARAIYQTVMSFMNGQKTTKAGIGYAVKGAITGKTTSDQQQLYEAMVSGDSAQISRVKSRFKDASAVTSAIRKALRENDPRIKEAASAKFNGDLDEYLRIAKAILAEKHFSQDDVVAAINAEINAMNKGESTSTTSTQKASGMFKADDFAVAISNGDSAMANAVKVDIIQTAQKNGKSVDEAEKSFNTSAKSSLKEAFIAGEISEQKAISALTTYCGVEEIEAQADVRYWSFKQDYPDVYADDSWFDAYYDKLADSGIDIGVYMEYRNKVLSLTGNDKKERRMEIIDSLPITSAQKDAMYYAEGWAARNLSKAPWH